MDIFVKRLQELLEEKELRQRELASLVGVTEVTISRYISGERKPRFEIASKIADVLNVSTDYLLGKTDHRSQEPARLGLTRKNQQEIDEYIAEFEQGMLANGGLMLNGEPLSEESKEKIIAAMRVGAELAKKQAKEKFTPKKYRG